MLGLFSPGWFEILVGRLVSLICFSLMIILFVATLNRGHIIAKCKH